MRKTHIKTDFINFIIEKYSKPDDDDRDEETPKKKDEDEDGDEENTPKKSTEDDDDEIIEKLLNEYKNVKRQYENRRVSDRRK